MGLWRSGGILFWRLSICVLKYAPSDALKPRMAFFLTRSANRALISMMRLCSASYCSPISVFCRIACSIAPFLSLVSLSLCAAPGSSMTISLGHALW